MNAEQYQHVKEIFLAVLERAPDDRPRAVDELCAGDEQLKSEVRSLLAAHDKAEISGQKIEVMTAQTQIDPSSENADNGTIMGLGLGDSGLGDPSLIDRIANDGTRGPSSGRVNIRGRGVRPRFAPGTIVAGRYRISDLLGAGGMGEVYRADDLTLDQSVALKFLPPSFSNDPQWLARFYNEVRLSRQVTHPNVCRVFDIGQVDGEQFISMEFVDGEDLASLLRRIGRLPNDKAVQISRQLCAGLAAAHDRGVLHRDLKPANIMLDGRGDVRITDFGISAPMGESKDAVAGTPAYMAPEQFKGAEATVRTDVYSLGLVLYEIFTGKPAFAGQSVLDYARLHRQTQPTDPSTLVSDMDPIVEQVILRCLEKDPTRRPATALAVAAALPGGDPLAAALAAGETPSPEMVAAAGGNAALRPLTAAGLLVGVITGLVIAVILAGHALLLPRGHFDKPAAVLEDKAHTILSSVGDITPVTSKASGFGIDSNYLTFVQTHDNTASRWDKLTAVRPGMGLFWYRESPRYMLSRDDLGMITLDEPARDLPGMRTVILDVQGHLKTLEILPDKQSTPSATTRESQDDLAKLFVAANLNQADFKPVESRIVPPMYADHRYAWAGTYPETGQPVRVEAATLDGRPVYFSLIDPWMEQTLQGGTPQWQDLFPGSRLFHGLLVSLLLASGVLLAWKNIRARRGDVGGALRLGASFLVLGLAIWALASNHVPQFVQENRQFTRALGFILVPAAIVWMFYLAMEPYVRRNWPETVISWTRLLSGHFTDPLVMSHILTGLLAGAGMVIFSELGNLAPLWFGHASQIPPMLMMIRLLGSNNAITGMMIALLMAMYLGLLYLLILVVIQLATKRRFAAGAIFLVAGAVVATPWQDGSWNAWTVGLISSGILLLLLVRFGLVSALAGLLVVNVMKDLPITPDVHIWYFTQTLVGVGTLITLAIFAAILSVRKDHVYRRLEVDKTPHGGARTGG